MDILTQIVEKTKEVIAERSSLVSLEHIRSQAEGAERVVIRLSARMQEKRPHIIAEFKRKSPSRPNINMDADPVAVARSYEEGGASAMSVLTEPHFFAGSPDDLKAVRAAVNIPLLRKDFIIDPYQLYEARVMGADLVLLIARILSPAQLKQYTALAHELGMEVLCEVHNLEEIARVGDAPVDFLGVNCRDLKKFSTNLDHLIHIKKDLPDGPWHVAESGIHSHEDLRRLYDHGYPLFLIGEYLMKSGDPVGTLKTLAAP